MSNKKLPNKLEIAFINNVLAELSNDDFIRVVNENISVLEEYIEGEEYIQNFKYYKKNRDESNKHRRTLAHLIWGRYIDLEKLDNERIKQIDRTQEKFISINKIVDIHDWLSGGTTIIYEGTDSKRHEIYIEYPFNRFIIYTPSLIGSIHFDGRLVPILSDLEQDIIDGLSQLQKVKHPPLYQISIILKFLLNGEYEEIAYKLGRKKTYNKG